jgi:hypothetical protein
MFIQIIWKALERYYREDHAELFKGRPVKEDCINHRIALYLQALLLETTCGEFRLLTQGIREGKIQIDFLVTSMNMPWHVHPLRQRRDKRGNRVTSCRATPGQRSVVLRKFRYSEQPFDRLRANGAGGGALFEQWRVRAQAGLLRCARNDGPAVRPGSPAASARQ